jgi:hypothetical protein
MATIGTRQINNQPQFGAGIIDVLPFKCPFPRFVSPHQAFVDVQKAIDGATYSNDTPTSCLANLRCNSICNGDNSATVTSRLFLKTFKRIIRTASTQPDISRIHKKRLEHLQSGGE